MANYSELRRLLTDKSPDPQTANCRLANAAVDALPGLLDEIERMHQADQDEILRVGTLTSQLALANRCNDELNQSATEYARKFYEANRSITELNAKRDSLFDAIAHGDADHRAWLLEAINAHFGGKPVPGPRGQGRQALV